MQGDLELLKIDAAAATEDLRGNFGCVRGDTPLVVQQVLATLARRNRTEHDYERCAVAIADVGGQSRVLLVDYYDDDKDFFIFGVQGLVSESAGALTRLDLIERIGK